MAETFKAADGSSVTDGDACTLRLSRGRAEDGDYSEYEVTGTVRAFQHVERVYDDEHIAVGKTSETRWEILTGDPIYPAIGVRPEQVLTRK